MKGTFSKKKSRIDVRLVTGKNKNLFNKQKCLKNFCTYICRYDVKVCIRNKLFSNVYHAIFIVDLLMQINYMIFAFIPTCFVLIFAKLFKRYFNAI